MAVVVMVASMLIMGVRSPVSIGVRKGSLVLQHFEQSIEQHSKNGA